MTPPEIVCIPVRQNDGTLCFESVNAYRRSPRAGTYIVRDHRREPISLRLPSMGEQEKDANDQP
jgi:hypothetical protein